MVHLRLFENFNNRDKLISEIQTILHILQDENHDVLVREIAETIIINVEVYNAQNIENQIYTNHFPGVYIEDEILDTIMKLEEVVEFNNRLEEICDRYNHECETLYDSELIFYITPNERNI